MKDAKHEKDEKAENEKKVKKPGSALRRYAALGAVLLVIAATVIWYCLSESGGGEYPLTAGCAEIHFVDVGQGDAILIRTPGGSALIDAGPNAAESTLRRYLRAQRIGTPVLCFFTHADEDHIGGADMVLSEFGAAQVVIPKTEVADTTAFTRLITAAGAAGSRITEVTGGEDFSLGDVKFTVLSAGSANESTDGKINSASIVLRVTVGQTSMILMGDAESETEERLLAAFPAEALKCDLLKVGHHGARTGTGDAWLDVLCPDYAVVSCAAGNSYGHPHAQTLARLASHGTAVFRTDESGSIVFYTDGKRLIHEDKTR